MAFPSSILSVLVELQLNTREWTDITSYTYGTPGAEEITLQRGRSSEGFAIEPAQATLKLDNSDGRFSYRNPRSPYYGLFTRNSPVRVSVRPGLTTGAAADLADAFGRTVALGDSWGTADSGQSWTRSSVTNSNRLSVSSGKGRILVQTAGEVPGVKVTGAAWADFDLYVTFTFPVALTQDLRFTIMSRARDASDTDSGQGLRVTCKTTAAVQLTALACNPEGALATNATATPAITHTGQALRVRFRTAGITVMGKVWDPAATAEPAAWQVTADDTTAAVSKAPGTIVITAVAVTGNTNVPFTATVDDVALTAIEPRYCGELTSIPNRWTPHAPSAGPVWVPVQSGGILRRLSGTQEKPKSAMWRFIEANPTGLQGYWPGNAGESAGLPPINFQFAVLGALAGRSSGAGSLVFYNSGGSGTLADWLEAGVQLSSPTNEFAFLDRINVPVNSGAGWSVDWVRNGGQPATVDETLSIFSNNTTTTTAFWQLAYDSASSSTNMVITDPNGATHSASVSAAYDGAPHHFRFTTAKSGSNITYALYLDGVSLLSGTVVAPDENGAALIKVFQVDQGDTHTASYGHFAVWDTSAPSVVTAAAAALGNSGETASARIIRVCQEEGIPYRVGSSSGELGESLGQQPIGTPYDVLAAAAAADQGILTELRDSNGLLYVVRNDLYQQTAIALTYTTDGHLQAVPEPTDDDATVVNTSTVTRMFASSRTYEATTGPLNSSAPPVGAGRKVSDATLNVVNDTRSLHAAEWRVAQGTVDESRWPVLVSSLGHLATHGLTTLFYSIMRADQGSRITLDTLPSFLPPASVDQMVLGETETIDQFTWLCEFNCAPYGVYNVGVWDSSGVDSRWDAAYSTLASSATSTATSLSVATSQGSLWTTSAGDFPFYINVGGVRVQVTNISGASSPQTFTVVRSIDGFDIALSAGATVSLWSPVRWGL